MWWFWHCHQLSWTNASIGSPTLSFWSRILESTISHQKLYGSVDFSLYPNHWSFFFFNDDFQSVILKISLFSYVAKHGLGGTMLEDTLPSIQTGASSDFLSQRELSDQPSVEEKQSTLFLYQAPSLPPCTTVTTCISIFLFVFIIKEKTGKKKKKKLNPSCAHKGCRGKRAASWLADTDTMASSGFIKSTTTSSAACERMEKTSTAFLPYFFLIRKERLLRLGPFRLHWAYCEPPFLSPEFQHFLQSLTFTSARRLYFVSWHWTLPTA